MICSTLKVGSNGLRHMPRNRHSCGCALHRQARPHPFNAHTREQRGGARSPARLAREVPRTPFFPSKSRRKVQEAGCWCPSRPRTPTAGYGSRSGHRYLPSGLSEPPVYLHRLHRTHRSAFRPSRIGELLRRSSPCPPRAEGWAFDSSGSSTRAHVSALKVRSSLDLALPPFRGGRSATIHQLG